MKLDVVFIEQR